MAWIRRGAPVPRIQVLLSLGRRHMVQPHLNREAVRGFQRPGVSVVVNIKHATVIAAVEGRMPQRMLEGDHVSGLGFKDVGRDFVRRDAEDRLGVVRQ